MLNESQTMNFGTRIVMVVMSAVIAFSGIPMSSVGAEAQVADSVKVETIQKNNTERLATKKKATKKKAVKQTKKITVTKRKAMKASAKEIKELAAIIQCEAGGENANGKLAVANVVINRVKSKAYAKTIHGVITQKGQFSPVRSGKFAKVLRNGKISKACYTAAKQALAGKNNIGSRKSFRAGTKHAGLVICRQVFF